MTTQRASSRRQDLRAAIDNPDTGSIKRRFLRRKLAGIVAVGPSAPPEPAPDPDRVTSRKIALRIEQAHRDTVEREIAAVDAQAKMIDDQLARVRRVGTGEEMELATERRQLLELKRMFEDDIRAGPITTDRDGRPVSDEMRGYMQFRAAEIAESFWSNAERADAERDHRRARTLRRDALRARHIAENEAGLRPSLLGYGISAWT